ncbi:MAG: hypothetical protein Q9O74_06905 [Planctomycetota bacterium]|nr:hypothetical protein [Planctomycetota bacterium]
MRRFAISAHPVVGFLLAMLLAGVAVLAPMGCARGAGPYQPVQLAAGDAAIYLYRPRSLLSPGPVAVFVDQAEVAKLRRNTHAVVIVGPGEHLVRVQRRSDATRMVRLGPGESLYLEVGAALLGGKVSLSDPGEPVAKARIVQTRAMVLPVKLKPGD